MATVFKTLAAGEFPVATPTTVYTVPGATTARLSELWVKNNAAVSRTCTIWVVNSGGAAGDDNELFRETLAAVDLGAFAIGTLFAGDAAANKGVWVPFNVAVPQTVVKLWVANGSSLTG